MQQLCNLTTRICRPNQLLLRLNHEMVNSTQLYNDADVNICQKIMEVLLGVLIELVFTKYS